MLTTKYLRYWHTRFNKLVFAGKLRRATLIIEPCGEAAGYCEATSPATIYIDPTLTREQARSVLLHEMVHQWQLESKLPMDHGRSFKQWETPCLELTGLPLWL
jgi:hypothetical protein